MDDPVLRIKLEGDPSPDASVNPQQQPPQTGLPNAPEQQSQLLDLQRIQEKVLGELLASGNLTSAGELQRRYLAGLVNEGVPSEDIPSGDARRQLGIDLLDVWRDYIEQFKHAGRMLADAASQVVDDILHATPQKVEDRWSSIFDQIEKGILDKPTAEWLKARHPDDPISKWNEIKSSIDDADFNSIWDSRQAEIEKFKRTGKSDAPQDRWDEIFQAIDNQAKNPRLSSKEFTRNAARADWDALLESLGGSVPMAEEVGPVRATLIDENKLPDDWAKNFLGESPFEEGFGNSDPLGRQSSDSEHWLSKMFPLEAGSKHFQNVAAHGVGGAVGAATGSGALGAAAGLGTEALLSAFPALTAPVLGFAVAAKVAVESARLLVNSVMEIDKTFLSLAKSISEIDASVATAFAEAEIKVLSGQLDRSQQIGPDLARYFDLRTDLDLQLQRILTDIADLALPAAQDAVQLLRGIAAVVEAGTSWLSQGNERASLANILDMLSYLPYMQHLSLLSPIVDYIVKWMDEQSEAEDAIALQNFLNLFSPAQGPPGVFPPPQRVPQPAGI